MVRKKASKQSSSNKDLPLWASDTELVAVTVELHFSADVYLPINYNYNLHAWFLRQVEKDDPRLSAYLHDGQSEKPFALSQLEGKVITQPNRVMLPAGEVYRWTIAALYPPLCQWLATWMQTTMYTLELRTAHLLVKQRQIALPATTYAQLFEADLPLKRNIQMRFVSPTGFRSKGHHLPLPIPTNMFHSYLRRWLDFAPAAYHCDRDDFLAWVEEVVFVSSHEIASHKVMVGKQGTVTGFTGTVELGIDRKAEEQPAYLRLLYALVNFAPYCGTGHKTPFGLGQTRLGTALEEPNLTALPQPTNVLQTYTADRIERLTATFRSMKKHPDSDRAQQSAAAWATILARREVGESLQAIATDLDMPYETVKSYCKLARRALATATETSEVVKSLRNRKKV